MTIFDDFWQLSKEGRLFYLLGTARAATLLSGVGVLLMLKRQQYLARKGSLRAARALLLPIYEPMILLFMASVLVEWTFLFLQHEQEWGLSFPAVLAMWSTNAFSSQGLIVFFCSHSLSQASMLRSLCFSFVWAVIGFLCAMVHLSYNKLMGQLMFHALPIVLFVLILRKAIYRRRSVVPAVQFMVLYRAVWCVYTVFTEAIESKIGYTLTLLALGLMEVPLCVLWYVTMWNDTYFWRTGGLRLNPASAKPAKSLVSGLWRQVFSRPREGRAGNSHVAMVGEGEYALRHAPLLTIAEDDEDEAMQRIARLQLADILFEREQHRLYASKPPVPAAVVGGGGGGGGEGGRSTSSVLRRREEEDHHHPGGDGDGDNTNDGRHDGARSISPAGVGSTASTTPSSSVGSVVAVSPPGSGAAGSGGTTDDSSSTSPSSSR